MIAQRSGGKAAWKATGYIDLYGWSMFSKGLCLAWLTSPAASTENAGSESAKDTRQKNAASGSGSPSGRMATGSTGTSHQIGT